MAKKLLTKTFLFLFSISLIIITLPFLNLGNGTGNSHKNTAYFSPQASKETVIFAALPENKPLTQTSVKTADARPEIIRQYLAKYGSDLEPYANLIVQLSDQYNFDYRWLVAIAQQESNLCKKIPANSYNCWGWGIYGDNVIRFDSYEDALITIAPKFKETFLKDEHLRDPYEVMATYTPPSNGSWAAAVLQFFKELE